MELEVSEQCPQGLANFPYPTLNKSRPHNPILFIEEINFNIVLQTMWTYSKGLFLSGFLTKILYVFLFWTCAAPSVSYPI
jgi:hypothetical protein